MATRLVRNAIVGVGLAGALSLGAGCRNNRDVDTRANDRSAATTAAPTTTMEANANTRAEQMRANANQAADDTAHTASAETARAQAAAAGSANDAPAEMTAIVKDPAAVLAALHDDNQTEIKVGRLAEKQGGSRAVKQFGAMMVRDHQNADRQVMAFAKKQNMDIDPGNVKGDAQDQLKKMADEHAQLADKLGDLRGAAFDRDFATHMTDDHQKAVSLVKSARDAVDDTGMKTLLAGLQPVLEKHLDHAKSLASTEDQGQAAGEDHAARSQGRRPAHR